MDAGPLLTLLAKLFSRHKFEAICIGNAAAALHGAPVTTIDVDFMFRDSPGNLKKLKAISRELGGVILRPYYPASKLYRVQRDGDGLQLDFMPTIHGVRSFASLRSRAQELSFGSHVLLVSSLEDIIRSKVAAGRDKDKVVVPLLERTLAATKDKA